jgi:hypothetical protein
MGKGRDKQGREAKKKKKAKVPGPSASDAVFRHHTVVTNQPEPSPRPVERQPL